MVFDKTEKTTSSPSSAGGFKRKNNSSKRPHQAENGLDCGGCQATALHNNNR
jgi:hypothetical protein